MSFTGLVCSKCGRTEEYGKAIESGWLVHQIKDAPEGHIIIRCPQHITAHALRLAGLPQQKTSKRIRDNLDRGLYVEYNGYIASVYESFNEDDATTYYVISYHKGAMPAFDANAYTEITALIQEMRKVEPDLRKWRLRES